MQEYTPAQVDSHAVLQSAVYKSWKMCFEWKGYQLNDTFTLTTAWPCTES